MIELEAVGKSFGGSAPRRLFSDVSLTVAPGEYVAIVGASGIGKSTLLNIIAGLERPDAGSVVVCDIDFSGRDDDALTTLRRTRMGFVFQAFHVLPYLSVGENVGLPLALQNRRGAPEDARVAALLDAVGLGDRAASRPAELSGGELQRVAIARALVHRPALVLADEPTGNLDPPSAARVIALLRETIRQNGAAGVLATHSRSAAASADRVYRLAPDGLHVAQGGDVE